jgi:hypothetical protein
MFGGAHPCGGTIIIDVNAFSAGMLGLVLTEMNVVEVIML